MSTYIEQSEFLNSIFRYQDPEIVANILQIELNAIINSIAPANKIQFKKNYCPFYNDEILKDLDKSQKLLNIAIETHDQNNWRQFKNFRNSTTRKIKKTKTEYLKHNFKNKNNQWKFLKNFNGNSKTQPPNNLTVDGKAVTSPKELATISNNFFINKIVNSRNKFTFSNINPIQILSFLIPRNKNDFTIPLITIKETEIIIKN